MQNTFCERGGCKSADHVWCLSTTDRNNSFSSNPDRAKLVSPGADICVLQGFIKCKGPRPVVYRVVWSDGKPEFAWSIVNGNNFSEPEEVVVLKEDVSYYEHTAHYALGFQLKNANANANHLFSCLMNGQAKSLFSRIDDEQDLFDDVSAKETAAREKELAAAAIAAKKRE